MTKAIGIKVKKAEGEHDLGASKFFGTPTLPSGMAEAFKDTEIFFCQIRCRDIAEAGLIAENDERIPHSGYLYVFLDTAEYPYRARVLHCVEEPAIARMILMRKLRVQEHLTWNWLMEFTLRGDGGRHSPFGSAHGLAVCGGTAACVHAV